MLPLLVLGVDEVMRMDAGFDKVEVREGTSDSGSDIGLWGVSLDRCFSRREKRGIG
jgi:hypothetical protein